MIVLIIEHLEPDKLMYALFGCILNGAANLKINYCFLLIDEYSKGLKEDIVESVNGDLESEI